MKNLILATLTAITLSTPALAADVTVTEEREVLVTGTEISLVTGEQYNELDAQQRQVAEMARGAHGVALETYEDLQTQKVRIDANHAVANSAHKIAATSYQLAADNEEAIAENKKVADTRYQETVDFSNNASKFINENARKIDGHSKAIVGNAKAVGDLDSKVDTIAEVQGSAIVSNKEAINVNKEALKVEKVERIAGDKQTLAESKVYSDTAVSRQAQYQSGVDARQDARMDGLENKMDKGFNRLDGAIASVTAQAALVQPKYAGDTAVSVGVANYNSEQGIALGVVHNFTAQCAVKVSVSADSATSFSKPITAAAIGLSF